MNFLRRLFGSDQPAPEPQQTTYTEAAANP